MHSTILAMYALKLYNSSQHVSLFRFYTFLMLILFENWHKKFFYVLFSSHTMNSKINKNYYTNYSVLQYLKMNTTDQNNSL